MCYVEILFIRLEVLALTLPVTRATNDGAVDVGTTGTDEVSLTEVFATQVPTHPGNGSSHAAPGTGTVAPATFTVLAFRICTDRTTSHLDKASGSLDTRITVVSFCIGAFHTTFAIDDGESLGCRNLSAIHMSHVATVVQDCSNHAIVIDKHFFGLETTHGVTGCTHLGHIQFLVQGVARSIVLLFEPVESGLAAASTIRRFASGDYNETVGSKATDNAFVL